MAEMGNDNGIEYRESDERVEIDPRDVRKINEPICLIKLTNGNYKQPTKREIKLLEKMGISNPCLGKSKSRVKPQTTKKVAASNASNVTKKVAPARAISKPAAPNNVSDLKKELENLELEQQALEAERIAAEEARIAAAAKQERATLERNKKLEAIKASREKAKNEKNEAAVRAAKVAEEEELRAAEAVKLAALAAAEKEAEDQIAKTNEVNKKFQTFLSKVVRNVKEKEAAAVVLAAAKRAAKKAEDAAAAVLAAAKEAAKKAEDAEEAAKVKAAEDLANKIAAEAARVARAEAARLQAELAAAQARELAAAEAEKVAAQEQAVAQAQKEALEELEKKAKAAFRTADLTGIGNATGKFNRKNYTKHIDFPNDYNTSMNERDIIHNTIRVKILKKIDHTKKDDDINSILNYLIRLIKDNKTVFQNKETYHILIQNVIKNIKKSLDNSESTSFKFKYDPATIFPPPRNETISSSNKSDVDIKYAYNEEMTREWLPPGKEINDENKQYRIEYKLKSTPDDKYKDFTIDNIVSSFPNSQGGKKHKNTKQKNTNQKNKKTLKKGGSNYNKKRYTMRKKKITRNKFRSRSRKTKTKKQKRGVKRPRYTKRR